MKEDRRLAGVIVRNIAEIEEASHRAFNQLSEDLKYEIVQLCKDTLSGEWHVMPAEAAEDGVVSVYREEWVNSETEEAEFYLSIDEVEDKDSQIERSWIGAATRGERGQSSLALYFLIEYKSLVSLTKFSKILGRHPRLVDDLRACGFERDESGKYLYVPIAFIDAEWLAAAFEVDDFESALEPVRRALQIATERRSLEALQRLIDLIRQEARANL